MNNGCGLKKSGREPPLKTPAYAPDDMQCDLEDCMTKQLKDGLYLRSEQTGGVRSNPHFRGQEVNC